MNRRHFLSLLSRAAVALGLTALLPEIPEKKKPLIAENVEIDYNNSIRNHFIPGYEYTPSAVVFGIVEVDANDEPVYEVVGINDGSIEYRKL